MMNKNRNINSYNKKNKIPIWFKYASVNYEKETNKKKNKEFFIK